VPGAAAGNFIKVHADGLDRRTSVQRLAALPDMTKAARIEKIESFRLSTE
jgi:hypothetical protein